MKIDGIERSLTREQTLLLHREMWEDMQNELGDDPTPTRRVEFKHRWLNARGYSDVECSCFLCEYARYDGDTEKCDMCPIDWTALASDENDPSSIGTCLASRYSGTPAKPIYRFATISEILALPERGEQT